jgi:2-phosphosulfolactate phosphatase
MRYLIGPEGKKEFLTEPNGVPIIIDALRASSTIVAALWAGAAEVIPVEFAGEALDLGKKIGAVLIGERGGMKIEGFDYNNSPVEMLGADIKDKTVVITTSNGTRIMVDNGIVGSTLNAGAVAEYIMALDRTYLLASNPMKSDEDLNAASLIEVMSVLLSRGYFMYEVERFVQNDLECQKLLDGIRNSFAGEKLALLGFSNDIDMICSDVNRFPLVPVYKNGTIKAYDNSQA